MATSVDKMSTDTQAESIYFLNAGAAQAEQDRLNRQHRLFDDMMQNDLLPPHVASALSALKTPPKILEVATGTAVWLTEVAKTLPLDAEFVGLDYDTTKFPSSLPPNITLRQADMFKPFSGDLLGKFDVVNVRLIIFALKEGQGTDLLLTSVEPPSQAWFRFQDINWRFAKKVGRDMNLPLSMVAYIKEAGCVDCDDKAYPGNSQLYTRGREDWISRTNVHVKALAEQSLRGITSLGGVEGMTTQKEVDELLACFDKEFEDRIVHYLFVRAWGRKPEAD
ncbi:hypothetical protein GQX73_g6983 [Xylaria multiplex]|uniref:Methyltransferase domain-containing protein n=1 Tax=Xylaria multiplex TaxID=323545 RepID=A0A7C8IQN7_9PEZI|nr:hypothetical protein GQX73_g6983 [Xylaria multiplex]